MRERALASCFDVGIDFLLAQYLNNLVEQDHRAIKRRCAPMPGFKSVKTAAVTISGIELAHRIRKRQFRCQSTDRRESLNLRTAWFAAVIV